MALFDDLGKKIRETKDDVVQSTKNFTNVNKYNNLISEEEKKIDNLYYQIGKVYYSMHKDCPEDEQKMYVDGISGSLQNINQYREEIKSIKGVTNCPQCGAEVSYSSAFCNVCGAKIPLHQTSSGSGNMIKCSNCGNMVPNGYKFCTACGNLIQNVSVQIVKNEKGVGDSQTMVQSDLNLCTKTCPNCGENVNADMAFCTECGARL